MVTLLQLIQQLYETLIHLSPDSINTFVAAVGPVLLLYRAVPDHLRRDGAGRDAVPAGRFAALRRRCRDGQRRLADPAGHDRHPAGRRRHPRRRGQLRHRLLHRAAGSSRSENSRLLNKKHLLRAHEFYEEYGGLTIILARFMPIVRTFAPFVAGIGKMSYPRFAVYNVVGGAVWVASFLLAGWWFGGLEIVQKNFHLSSSPSS